MDDCSEGSKQSSKSAWMAHWMRTSCRPLPPDDWTKNDGLLIPPEEDDGSSKLVKGCREGTKIKLMNFVDESLTTSSKNLRSEFLPVLTSLQNSETVLIPNNGETSAQHEGVLSFDTGLNPGINVSPSGSENYLPKVPVLASSGTGSQLRKSPFQPEGITWNWAEEVKPSEFAGKSNLDVSEHLQDYILGSSSEIVQHEFNSGRTSTQPLFGSGDHIYQSDATFFILEKRMDKKESLSIHDPSTSNNWQRSIIGKKSQKVKNHSDIKLFHSHTNRPDMSKLEELHHGSYGLPGIHSSVHDVEKVRIYTSTVDSVQEFSREPPKFSQTTDHLLITKKTDVNLSDGDQISGKLSMPTNFKGKAAYELFSLSPHFGSHVKQGVKLQPIDSATESEGKVIMDTVAKTSATNTNNESSDDTDTLEMHTFKGNHLSGWSLSPSNTDVKESQKMLVPEASIPLFKEGRGKLNSVLPYINQDIPVFAAMANSEDDKETSTSRTQSLDVPHFLSLAEHPRDLNSSTCLDVNFGMDPCSRWVKRLKPNASDYFGCGTESSRMEEACKILNCKASSSEPKMIKSSYGKEHSMISRTKLPRNARSPSFYSVGKSQEIRVSRAWIQRWCHVQSAFPKGISGDAVGTEPKRSKTTLDFRKKQFPSIAAIALMGKAMTGFRPCKFRKKGSIVSWNAWG